MSIFKPTQNHLSRRSSSAMKIKMWPCLLLLSNLCLSGMFVLPSFAQGYEAYSGTQYKDAHKPKVADLTPVPYRDAGKLIPPPGETQYFPVRADGQDYILNIDQSINLTDFLNRIEYNTAFGGEVWSPFDHYSLIRRAERLMALYPDFNEAVVYRRLNGVNRWFERKSGFGP